MTSSLEDVQAGLKRDLHSLPNESEFLKANKDLLLENGFSEFKRLTGTLRAKGTMVFTSV